MAARRHVTNTLRAGYRKASKIDRGRILDKVVVTTGMGRSTGRWALMGMPCGKYFTVMLPMWLPLPLPLPPSAGDLDKPFATRRTIGEIEVMSPATVDRYLAPARHRLQLRGIATTTRAPALPRNSIGLCKAADAPPATPGVIEADAVAHCGPTFAGEFCRTLTMTDLVTGWTENASIRNNAAKWNLVLPRAQAMFPFPLTVFDSDNGSEFINHVHQPRRR